MSYEVVLEATTIDDESETAVVAIGSRPFG